MIASPPPMPEPENGYLRIRTVFRPEAELRVTPAQFAEMALHGLILNAEPSAPELATAPNPAPHATVSGSQQPDLGGK